MCFYAVIENQHSNSQFQVNNNTALIVAIDEIVEKLSSAVYAIAGDLDKARELQEQFLDKTSGIPVVSQLVSAGYAIGGDLDTAREHQEKFLDAVQDFADQVPGVGHIKGGIHYAMGENEKGDESMKSASRTVGVIAGGVIGLVAGGPAGAAVGGAAGGVAMDLLISGSEVLIHGDDGELHGYVKHGAKIVDALANNQPYTLDDAVELVTQPMHDVLVGYRTVPIIHDTPPIKSIPGLIKQGVIVTESLPPSVASSSTTISSLGSK
ncbi:hypothetical protein Fcan01_18451 [Folsomia candida]|uniref:Uncharacterized protein n=1 Tax=Folsomia candida TaxID=158441 RepID=A0A226DPB8_FOLCA|nr:hypothetical protein Fcan01_18451 [Folsomia candida]